jgi:hypothetical protein
MTDGFLGPGGLPRKFRSDLEDPRFPSRTSIHKALETERNLFSPFSEETLLTVKRALAQNSCTSTAPGGMHRASTGALHETTRAGGVIHTAESSRTTRGRLDLPLRP